MNDFFLWIATITTIVDAILAGSVLDYAIKQLPARKIIGMIAYRKYFLASDLANGRFWYVPLGLSAYVLNVTVALLAYFQNGITSSTILFIIAAGFALIHAFGTSQAVPAGMRFLKVKDDNETTLNKSFDKFARWVVFRGIVGAPMFVAMLLGLIVYR
ncbi:MAG: hypothetical protein OK439_05585 [Thaumarchaeota archaeon]|nr:hypothetical protein [Nitrososphaerota archaeon]